MCPVRNRPPILLAAALLCAAGCASLRTDKSHYAGMDRMLERADYPAAIARIESAREKAYTQKDRVVYYLDMGMLYHWNGDYARSNELLEKAERGIEENFTRSLSRSASSLILNDNVLAYAGEDYEDVYLNAFKALNYLALGQTDEAFVEVRRIDQKLAQLESRNARVARKLSEAEEAGREFVPGKSCFQQSAFGRYLGLLLYRNEGKWDDTRIDRDYIGKAWKLQPDIYTFPEPDLTPALQRLPATKARLNIVAFSGLAPDKKASTFYIHTEEELVVLAGTSENYLGKQDLDGLSVIPWPGVAAGYHFKIQLPYMERHPSAVERIEVVVAGGPQALLEPLESLENAAIETFGIRKPLIYLKTVTRAVSKGLASEQAKQQMTENMDGGMAFFTRLAADLMVDQTENADLRVSRFFPAKASIAEIHLDEGSYDIAINYYGRGGNLLRSDMRTGVRVVAGELHLLESALLN